jgi:hypothetical protein
MGWQQSALNPKHRKKKLTEITPKERKRNNWYDYSQKPVAKCFDWHQLSYGWGIRQLNCTSKPDDNCCSDYGVDAVSCGSYNGSD